MKLYAYNQASESAKALSQALGIKRIKHEGKVLNMKNKPIINWGNSKPTHEWRDMINIGGYINHPSCVRIAVSKLLTLQTLLHNNVSTPDWCTAKEHAAEMLKDGSIVCRTKLNGHSGEGIVIAKTIDELVDAPLYVQYIPKTQEYRCHVMHGEVFFIQRKARKLEVEDEDVNWQVRNLAGGFIYANKDVNLPEAAKEQAIMAVQALGLDFGAVDLIYGTDKKYYVLEVNTACGLAGTTLDKYVEQFKLYV
jgi:glutathione synthase/RimK-type ligase-like ATP-grasp enzyme